MNPRLAKPIDLGLVVLDHQLVDSDGRYCGKVDDIEFEGDAGADLVATAMLVGPGNWSSRLPRFLHGVARRVFPDQSRSIPFEEVADVTGNIKLARTARELGLGKGDYEAARFFGWLPRRQS